MPARKIKSLRKELGHRAHREHRSRRGRRPFGKSDREHVLEYRKQLNTLTNQEQKREIKRIWTY